MLAAPYLLPALLLQRHVAIGTMTGGPDLQAAHWTIFTGDAQVIGQMWLMCAIAAAALLFLVVAHRRVDPWGWFMLAATAMAMGALPFLWRLPPLANVQFPWRLLQTVDFTVAVMVTRGAGPDYRRALGLLPLLVLSFLVWTTAAPHPQPAWLALLQTRHPDVVEYLPHGIGEAGGAYSLQALRRGERQPAVLRRSGWTILHHHAFPAWQVRCADSPAPSRSDGGLIAYRGSGCTLHRRTTGPEIAGWLLAIAALPLVRRRRAVDAQPATVSRSGSLRCARPEARAIATQENW